MAKHQRSEYSYIANDILPLLHNLYGYPIHDAEKVKINDVPIMRASGARSGAAIDLVYYHDGEPLIIVEAKRDTKSHEAALKEALNYLRNFPKELKEFSESGKRPKFLATTVGKEVKFYKWRYDIDYEDYVADPLRKDVSYNDLLAYYGFSRKYKARLLKPEEFKADFFDELIDMFRGREIINRDVIRKIVMLLYNYLRDQHKYTYQYPCDNLSAQKMKLVHDLFHCYDFIKSLSPALAGEFRRCVIRAFQGAEFNQYMTDESVIEFMCAISGRLRKPVRVLDFECGSGGFLAEAVSRWNLSLNDVYGVDIDELPYYTCKTYLALYFKKKSAAAMEKIPVLNTNGLFYHGNNYNLVIGNPAGSNKYGHGDESRIFEEGLKGDLKGNEKHYKEYDLSVQQAIRSCKAGGKICLILPDGFFSNASDHYLRKLVADNCKVLGIISLPKGTFKQGRDSRIKSSGASAASMKMSILLAEKYKSVKRKHSGNYHVFLASVAEPLSVKGEVKGWMKSRLNLLLLQWNYWQKRKKLLKMPRQKHALIGANTASIRKILK